MNQLTRSEVEAWPATGPMALKAERVLQLFDELEGLRASRQLLETQVATLRPLVLEFRRYGSCDQSCNYRRECICGWAKMEARLAEALANVAGGTAEPSLRGQPREPGEDHE